MLTHETVFQTYPYDYRFKVFDDSKKVVTIELENEWGASGESYPDWEHCLASAILNCLDYADYADLVFAALFHDMISDKRKFCNALSELRGG